MKTYISLLVLMAITLVACSPYGSHTADSPSDIRWEKSSLLTQKIAPDLDCSSVDACHSKSLFPDFYQLKESGEELYVWTYTYNRLLNARSTVLYVVNNRPKKPNWDLLGLEYLDDKWQVGVYEGQMLVSNVSIPLWGLTSVDPIIKDGHYLAIGMANEPWAIIVSPTSISSFRYSINEFYWKDKE